MPVTSEPVGDRDCLFLQNGKQSLFSRVLFDEDSFLRERL